MEHLTKIATIILINLVLFFKTLRYGYVGDDVERSHRQEPKFKNKLHGYWIQFIGLRHTNPMHSHVMTLFTHILCCLSIYLVLGRNNISFVAALLFSINPANIQGSVWISGRNYVTSAILSLWMIAFPALSWAFYLGTSYFAVNAWFAPLAFLGTKYWYMVGIIPIIWVLSPTNRATIHRKLWETGSLKTTNKEMRAIKLSKLIPFIKTYMYYFAISVIPFHIAIEHNFLRGFGTNKTDNERGYKIDRYFWMGLTLISCVAFICIKGLFTGWTPLSWGLFWFSINIAMWCNFVTYQQQVSERYIYLANIGMMLALASLIAHSPILITAFLIGYAVRMFYVMEMYTNDYWAVEYSVAEIKKMHYMWLMRGVKKFMMKDYPGALFDFHESYLHKPYDLKSLYNLAVVHFILGSPEQSKKFLQLARTNIYDELDEYVTPALDKLEEFIKQVEKAKERGERDIKIDLKQIMIVK